MLSWLGWKGRGEKELGQKESEWGFDSCWWLTNKVKLVSLNTTNTSLSIRDALSKVKSFANASLVTNNRFLHFRSIFSIAFSTCTFTSCVFQFWSINIFRYLQCSFVEHRNYKIVYRRYASLFFLVGVDNDEVIKSFSLSRICICFIERQWNLNRLKACEN